MEILRTVHIFVKSLFVLLLCSVGDGRESELNYVTCGSLVKLLNTKHNVRLHSHDVKYGSGNFTFTIHVWSITPTRVKYSSPTRDSICNGSGEILPLRSWYQMLLNEKDISSSVHQMGRVPSFVSFCVCRRLCWWFVVTRLLAFSHVIFHLWKCQPEDTCLGTARAFFSKMPAKNITNKTTKQRFLHDEF